ncbi:MAG: protein-L-isoaspartate(D-aspartate) O-methyltransferase [bacterium]
MKVSEWKHERERMVKEQIVARGIEDTRVIQAMNKVPRHLFIENTYYHQAYNDYPLPIGQNQTISQPYMVASMTELLELKGNERVLEIGTGSGYQTAILALLCSTVYSVERISELTRKARLTLKQLGFSNINLIVRDGTLGWSEFAPYNGIIVTAGAPEIPNALIKQLANNGRMVIPVGNEASQTLNFVEKHKGRIYRKEFFGCAFVPLVGKGGWK